MPNNATVKTVSAHKRKLYFRISIITAAVLLIICSAAFLINRRNSDTDTLSVGGKTYSLLLATTAAAQDKGLGDRASLPTNKGMLFIFGSSEILCFWMKDMHFPLDMIWLNSNKQVEYIKYDALPSSYPNSFCPNVGAQYVIELNAGQANAAHLQVGQKLDF